MKADRKWTVIIADDHPLVRRGLRAVLSEAAEVEIVAEVGDGPEACRAIRELHPQIAILDYGMPRLNGLEVVRRMTEQGVSCAFVILTMHKEEDLFNAAIDDGVLGYVLKDNAAEDLLACLRTVMAGENYISPEISKFLLRRAERARLFEQEQPGLAKLTPGERRVLKLIAEGHTSKEIGDILGLSPHTVDNHRGHMAEKLELQGTHSLLKFAFEHRQFL